jgi:RNA polymerase sigma-70 factor, ECF subfamily
MNTNPELALPDDKVSSSDPDSPLVKAAQEGDAGAMEELIRRYDRRLFRIAQNIVQQREDAQDVVQEALFKAFSKLNQFHGRSRFSTWIIRITLNEAFMKVRGQRAKSVSIDQAPDTEEGHPPREIEDWAPNPEMLYQNSELRNILEESLRALGPKLRTVFLLRDVEGLSIEDVAHALNLSQTAVKTRTLRARLRLREKLTRYFGKGDHRLRSGSATEASGKTFGVYHPTLSSLRCLEQP